MRDREQPPLDEDEPARELLGILDVEPRRVRRVVGKGEGRVLVRAEGAVGVEADAPRPAEDADVEVEDPAGVAAGEEDREACDDGREHEADPEEEENDEVRDGEQPLEEPLPAAYVGIELAGQAKRERRLAGRSCSGAPSIRVIGGATQRHREAKRAPSAIVETSLAASGARRSAASTRISRMSDGFLRGSTNRAVEHARRAIEARQYVLESDWGEVQPDAAAENDFLEHHSWEEYGEWHLGLTAGVPTRRRRATRSSTATFAACIAPA